MSFVPKFKQIFSKKETGQGLAEFAGVSVVLLVMVIGLFEVGYGLWGYLTLLNVNREAARFSIRPNVVDFSTTNKEEIGYGNIINHTLTSNADQLNLQEYLENTENSDDPDAPKAAIVVTHIVVDTGKPCEDMEASNCCDPETSTYYAKDDLILHSKIKGYEHLSYVYPDPEGSNTDFESRLDMVELVGDPETGVTGILVDQNNEFNCALYKKSGSLDFSDNSVVVVETLYEQPQLLGFPLYSWFANPVPLYASTMLRVDSAAENLCSVLPIAVHISTAQKMDGTGLEDDLWQGDNEPNSSSRGWLSWNGESNAPYLNEELNNSRLSTTDYRDPTNTSDTTLNVDNWVSSLPGTTNSSDVRQSLEYLMGKTVMLPVYDHVAGSGSNARYQIHSFAKVRIGASDLPPGKGGYINGTIMEWPVDGACP